MKSLVQVVNLIPPALGGVIVVILAKFELFVKQVNSNWIFLN